MKGRDASGALPSLGERVVDVRSGRAGVVMDVMGSYVHLRPLEGGREWEVPPRFVRPLGRAKDGEGEAASPAGASPGRVP